MVGDRKGIWPPKFLHELPLWKWDQRVTGLPRLQLIMSNKTLHLFTLSSYCIHCVEAELLQSQPTADLSTSCYQSVTNSHPSHSTSLSTTTKCPSNGPRPASANIPLVSSAVREAVTDLALSKSSLDARRDAIRQQMVELNQQRLLAQAKVDELKQQGQQFAQQVPATLVVYNVCDYCWHQNDVYFTH